MTPTELHNTAREALAITGAPTWESADDPGRREVLTYLPASVDGDEPVWALVPADVEDADEFLIDTALAETLIAEHLREWLLARGWQVQTAVRRGEARWRLADCLAVTEGGGDRLEIEAPHGDNELGILCESVVLLNGY
jgi:hypothetical protein